MQHKTSNNINENKLREYKDKHPSFNWNEIECKLQNTNIPMNDKSSTMKLFENEWFIYNSEQKREKGALESFRGVATKKFREDSNRYSKRISKRKNDFVESVLLKNTSPLKRSRMEEVNEETNCKKTSLSSLMLQELSDLEQFYNECSIESSDLSVSFDTRYLPGRCMDLLQGGICSRCWKLEGEVLEVNLTELNKATKEEQKQIESALGGIMGEVEIKYVSSIDLHLQIYSKQMRERKNDFIDPVFLKSVDVMCSIAAGNLASSSQNIVAPILKDIPSLKRSRMEEYKSLCQLLNLTALQPLAVLYVNN